MSNRDYYVYIDWRLDTNEPFYIGKGSSNRYCDMNGRNDHFKRIENNIPIAVEIVKDNLTEDEAHGIECYLIHELVFEYGFSIDIKNNRSSDGDWFHLVNATWGGEGASGTVHTEEQKKKWSEERKGENNPMYGLLGELNPNFGIIRSQEFKDNLSNKRKGENNPFFGKNHTEETLKKLREAFSGENNPMYGKQHTEEARKKMSKKSKGNQHRAESVICLTTKRIFFTAKEGAEYYKKFKANKSVISECCKGKKKSSGKLADGTKLVWRKLVHKHDIVLKGSDISKLHKNKKEVA